MQLRLYRALRKTALQKMTQEQLGVGFGDADSKGRADQMFMCTPDQPCGGDINLLDPPDAIEGHVTDRGEIKQIDVALDGGLQLRLGILENRFGCCMDSCAVSTSRSVSAVRGITPPHRGDCLHVLHRRSN